MSDAMSRPELPPRPEPTGFKGEFSYAYGYTHAQLDAYARLAIAAYIDEMAKCGFVLVPLEPTREMEYAWHNGRTSTHQRFRERWRNALAAAPKPEDADG